MQVPELAPDEHGTLGHPGDGHQRAAVAASGVTCASQTLKGETPEEASVSCESRVSNEASLHNGLPELQNVCDRNKRTYEGRLTGG